jgi:flavodoxin
MRKTFLFFGIFFLVTGIYAQNTARKALVVYFSWSGHTQVIARDIQKATGADIFRVETVNDYPTQYRECTGVAKKEQNDNARPELKVVPDFSNYDTIYLGWPCWWGTMPMVYFTMLEQNNLAGKTVVPFTTHGGSGFGRSLRDLGKLCPNAKILEGLSISGGRVNGANQNVIDWLKKIGQLN